MTTVAMISAAKRKSLPEGKFALPEQRKYPIDTAARVRNAAARLEQQKGSMPAADYTKAKRAIGAAAKRFGIASEYNRKADDSAEGVHVPGALGNKPSRVRMRKGLHMKIGADGNIEVRHTASDTASPEYGESVALTDAANLKDAEPVWIQVAKVGQFAGHPAGPFRLDEKTFGEIVHNFRSTQNKRIPIDFEHASEADATAGSIPTEGAPAQGWIVDLDNRGAQGLWALVEWGDKAREYIREGQYRYISPAVRFNSRDRVTNQPVGARLTSAGLTNQPFLDGMQPLAARDRPMLDTPLTDHGSFMSAMRACLKLSEVAPYRDCAERLGHVREMCMSAAGAGKDPMGIHEGVDLGGYIAPMKALMNMPANASLDDLFDAVEEMIEAAIARHEALYHEDDDPDSASMADRTGDAAMADTQTTITNKDADPAALAAALKDEQTKREAAEARASEIALQMREMQAQLTTLKANDESRAKAEAERLAREQEERVTETIAVYSDKKGISEADRNDLLVMLRAAPASFDKLYPRVAPAQRHLMRNLTATQTGTIPAAAVSALMTNAQNARRPDVPNFEAPAAVTTTTPEGLARGRALKALSAGASLEQAILMANRAPTSTPAAR